MHEADSAEKETYSLRLRGWYRVVRGILSVLFHTLSRFEVEGLENVPDRGPYLLATNHLHWLDSPAFAVGYPHRPYVVAGEKWAEHWILGPLLKSLDAIFVHRGEVDRQALRKALAVLEGGGVLGLAPEGTRSKTGGLQPGHGGPAFMALRTGAGVLPAVATGQEKLFWCLRHGRRTRLHIRFGPAFDSPIPPTDKPSAAQVHAFTEEIMYHLAGMLPPEYRGVYGDVEEKRPELVREG